MKQRIPNFDDFEHIDEAKIPVVVDKTVNGILKKFSKDKIKDSLTDFANKLKEEGNDYKEVKDIVFKAVKEKQKLSKEETKIFKTQLVDTFKMGFLVGVLFCRSLH